MGAFFARVKRFADTDLPLPERGTEYSAGYDLAAAEDTIIPAYKEQQNVMNMAGYTQDISHIWTLNEVKKACAQYGTKPTLVPTGIKCHLESNQYLKVVARSSTPLKYWLIVPNAEGIIDADYYSNESNDGEIFVQVLNLFPYPIKIAKGEKIAQGIICIYDITENDKAKGTRTGGFGSTT